MRFLSPLPGEGDDTLSGGHYAAGLGNIIQFMPVVDGEAALGLQSRPALQAG